MEHNAVGGDVFFILMGAILVFAMHAGFAFLEVGTVRRKNQVNAMVKIISDFGMSTLAYFFIGYGIAYGIDFLSSATVISGVNSSGSENETYGPQGLSLIKFFFLLTFAAAIPAIISGGIAERAKFGSQLIASGIVVALVYPFFEGMIWNGNFGFQGWLEGSFGASFHDFAGSVVVHAVGGWLALAAVILLGARLGRYGEKGSAFPPSSIPWLALGSWLLCIGWFGFNVVSAQSLEGISGLVAVNSLMAMVGGLLAALVFGKFDPGFVHNGALAGLVAVCAGSDVMHPVGALITGALAGVLFVYFFTICQERLKIDDVLGVWPLHGLAGAWGGIACGIFGQEAFGGLGGVSFASQLIGTLAGCSFTLVCGMVVYGGLKAFFGIRLSEEEERQGADLSIHKIAANPQTGISG